MLLHKNLLYVIIISFNNVIYKHIYKHDLQTYYHAIHNKNKLSSKFLTVLLYMLLMWELRIL